MPFRLQCHLEGHGRGRAADTIESRTESLCPVSGVRRRVHRGLRLGRTVAASCTAPELDAGRGRAAGAGRGEGAGRTGASARFLMLMAPFHSAGCHQLYLLAACL